MALELADAQDTEDPLIDLAGASMALNWKTVTAEHIRQACKKVAAVRTGKRASKIVIQYEGQTLPAKEVQRTAYLIANNLPDSTELKF